MVYATLAQFGERYQTRLPDSELNSHHLLFASARLDSLLAPYFSVPFSANNATARDLAIDLAYLLILQRTKAPADAAPLSAAVEGRLAALAERRAAMMTDSGEALFADSARQEVWSDTSGARPVFDLGDPAAQRLDPARRRDTWEGEP